MCVCTLQLHSLKSVRPSAIGLVVGGRERGTNSGVRNGGSADEPENIALKHWAGGLSLFLSV